MGNACFSNNKMFRMFLCMLMSNYIYKESQQSFPQSRAESRFYLFPLPASPKKIHISSQCLAGFSRAARTGQEPAG